MTENSFYFLSLRCKFWIMDPCCKCTMIKFYRFFQTFFLKPHISFDISLFQQKDIFFIEIINKCDDIFPLFRTFCLDKLDKRWISLGFCNTFYLLPIYAHINLHTRILDIIPVSDEIALQTKLIEELFSSLKRSLTIYIYYLIIRNLLCSLWKMLNKIS